MDDYKLYDIYPCQIAGFPFAVRENSDGRSMGDGIFKTREEAVEHVKFLQVYAERERVRDIEWATVKATEEKQLKEYLDSYGGWLSDDPMKRGRQLKTMKRNLRYEGKIYSRKELVEKKLSEGWTVKNNRLYLGNVFLDAREITKTAIQYAEYLGKQ